MSDTQLIKDKIDIVELVGEYVQLKPAGVNHKGLCPFHSEKSPSFMVNRDRQSWHCFGCSKGGDIFTFIEEIEGMEFIEALKFLAARAGVPLDTGRFEKTDNSKERLRDIVAEAARFFHNVLSRLPVSAGARDYLRNRGLKPETIENWMIGFIPDQWDLLTQYLLKKGFSIDDLVASGLTIRKDGADARSIRGFYDRFRGRVMFPIWDVHGAVVGFTGRVLVETEHSGGKYVNTPQTALYDKSRVVFGLNKAKQAIRGEDAIVMVEGQMDVVACHQAGMQNVVATSGTALTVEQIQLLKRYSNNLLIAFDADQAGQAAAKRGIDLAREAGMFIKVIHIPEGAGKDPDECLKMNPSVWFEAVKSARDIMEWFFERGFGGKNLSDPRQKQLAADEILPEILRIPYAVERDHWLRELAGRIGVDVSVLREDMARIRPKNGVESKNADKKAMPLLAMPPKPVTRLEKLMERALMLFLKQTSLPIDELWRAERAYLGSIYAPLYKALKEQYTNFRAIDINKIHLENDGAYGHDEQSLLDVLLMKSDLDVVFKNDSEPKEEYLLALRAIEEEWLRNERRELQSRLVAAERAHEKDLVQELIEKLSKLSEPK